jgi:Leucine-rich repeat (LRR) protein
MKQTLNLLSVFCLSLVLCFTSKAQTTAAHSFHLQEIRDSMGVLYKKAIEQVIVIGNNTPKGDSAILDTLRVLALPELKSTDGKTTWNSFGSVFKHLTIVNANWSALPDELGQFKRLFEIVLVNCPNLSLQTISQQVHTNQGSPQLLNKLKSDIISLSFVDADWSGTTSFDLQPNVFAALRDLRLDGIRGISNYQNKIFETLCKNYPDLTWLTIQHCGLMDEDLQVGVRNFTSLRSLSLRENRLSKIPRLHENLEYLDISNNLIDALPEPQDSVSLRELKFLQLDCNLLSYYDLMGLFTAKAFDGSVLSYACACDSLADYKRLSYANEALTGIKYLTCAPRYVNDFNPALPDCQPCKLYQHQVLNDQFSKTIFQDGLFVKFELKDWLYEYRVTTLPTETSFASVEAKIYKLLKINYLRRNTLRKGWEISLWVEDPKLQEYNQFDLLFFAPDNPSLFGVFNKDQNELGRNE